MRFRPCACFSKLLIHSQAAPSRKEKPLARDTPVWILARRLPRAPAPALRSQLLLPRASLPRGSTRELGLSSNTCRRCWSRDSTTVPAATRTSWPRYYWRSLAGLGSSWPRPACPLLASPSFPRLFCACGLKHSRVLCSLGSVSSFSTFSLILG